MQVRCQGCQEIVLIKRRADELYCECPNCSEITFVPPAARFSLRQQPVLLTFVSLAGLALLIALSALAFVGIELAAQVTNRAEVERADAALEAFLVGHYDQARDHYLALAILRPLSYEEHLRLAECHAAMGDADKAREAMQEIVRAPVSISAKAHYWLAEDLLSRSPVTPERAQQARERLELIVNVDPYFLQAQRLLLKRNVAEGRLKDALPQLRVLSGFSDADRLALAAAYRALGEDRTARHEASQVLKSSLAVALGGNPQARLLAARAAMLLGDFPQAEELLRSGWTRKVRDPDAPEGEVPWAAALSEMYLAWSQEVALGLVEGPEEIECIAQALEFVPDSELAYRRIVQIAARTDSEASRRALELLHAGMTRGSDALMFHTLLGGQASERKRSNEAVLHFRMALELSPGYAPAMNNLASELTWQEPPDLKRALALVDQAIQTGPDQAVMHETRGQILARMGRLREALGELALAANYLPNNARLHATLAELYQRLEMPELAREHISRANRLAPGVAFPPLGLLPH